MNNILVSVCIPVFNREKIIAHTIDSVINQSYKNIEIIVSDNCSTDNTFNILKSYAKKDSRIKLFKMEANKGPVQNWRNCFVNSSGQVIKFLWSDDYIDLDFIKRTLKELKVDVGFVYTPVKWYDVKSMKICQNIGFKIVNKPLLTLDFFVESLVLQGSVPVSGTCAIFRRNIIGDLFSSNISNCLNLNYHINGAGFDSLMFLYAKKHYNYFAYTDDVFAYYGVDKDGISVQDGEKLTPYYFSFFFGFLKEFKYGIKLIAKFKSRILFYKFFYIRDEHTKDLLYKLLFIINNKLDYLFLIKLIVKNYFMDKLKAFPKRILNKLKNVYSSILFDLKVKQNDTE